MPTVTRMLHAALALSMLVAVAHAPPARAATLKFTWTKNAEPDILGYKIYYDWDSGAPYAGAFAAEGMSPVDIPVGSLADPDNPSFDLHVPSCTRVYAVMTAYNALESDYTGEVFATPVDPPITTTIAPLTTSTVPGVELGWSGLDAADTGALGSYRIHYDLASGGPYAGTAALEGPSPIEVPVSALSNPLQPSAMLTGFGSGQPVYVVIEAVCPDGVGDRAPEMMALSGSRASSGSPGPTDPGDPGTPPPGPGEPGGSGGGVGPSPGDPAEPGSAAPIGGAGTGKIVGACSMTPGSAREEASSRGLLALALLVLALVGVRSMARYAARA